MSSPPVALFDVTDSVRLNRSLFKGHHLITYRSCIIYNYTYIPLKLFHFSVWNWMTVHGNDQASLGRILEGLLVSWQDIDNKLIDL